MKKLLTLLTACCLSTAATAPTVKPVEPKQNTATYYVLSADENVLAMVAGDVQVQQSHRLAWLLMFPHEPLLLNGKSYDFVWMLSDTDCSAKTVRLARTELEGGEGKVTVPAQTQPAMPIRTGSSADAVANLVCQNMGDPQRILPVDAAVKLMVAYRRAGQVVQKPAETTTARII